MYSVRIESSFSAAHNLKGYKGTCEQLHGHNWRVAVEVSGPSLDNTGILVDFRLMKKELNAVIKKLDHTHLNRIPYFKKINPTSENIARFIYESLSPSLPGLSSVTVWESDTSRATYHAG